MKYTLGDLTPNQMKRYPLYLNYLLSLNYNSETVISNRMISEALGINIEVVKKDIALITDEKGCPRVGRRVSTLVTDLKEILGHNASISAVLVGVGSLGKALLNYDGFKKIGLDIKAAFDVVPMLFEIDINGIVVYPIEQLGKYCRENNIRVGVITTNMESAQGVATSLIDAGVEGIWNFAPVHLKVKKGVVLENMHIENGFSNLYYNLYRSKKGE